MRRWVFGEYCELLACKLLRRQLLSRLAIRGVHGVPRGCGSGKWYACTARAAERNHTTIAVNHTHHCAALLVLALIFASVSGTRSHLCISQRNLFIVVRAAEVVQRWRPSLFHETTAALRRRACLLIACLSLPRCSARCATVRSFCDNVTSAQLRATLTTGIASAPRAPIRERAMHWACIGGARCYFFQCGACCATACCRKLNNTRARHCSCAAGHRAPAPRCRC